MVSPHFDDAVLSCAHVLLDGTLAVTVVTVCAAPPPPDTPVGNWDAACGFASGADAARVRREEDDAACARVGAAAVRLPFADGAYGARPPAEVLRAAVAELLRPDATVWLPAGIGGQPDHLAVRDALLPLLVARRGLGVLYADSPYAALAGWDAADETRPPGARWALALGAAEAAGAAVGAERRVRLDDAALDAKLGLVRCHASQLAQLGGVFPGLSHRHGLLATEVAWPLRGPRRRRSLPFLR